MPYTLKKPSIQSDSYLDLPIAERILALRDLEQGTHHSFLYPDFDQHTHSPFLLKDIQKTVDRIFEAVLKGEKILIYSDFDADGIPGSAIIHDFFRTIGYEEVQYIAPDRHSHGFGFHPSVVKPYIDEGVTLIITIDCGIADVAQSAEIMQYAQDTHSQTVDIVITDHHVPGTQLPKVFAIINPKQSDCLYPEKMLCGAAVIYKLVIACIHTIRESKIQSISAFLPLIHAGYEKWLLDLVGISTLSDMVPLVGENRTLAYFGLKVLRKTKRPGIQMLSYTNMVRISEMMEEDVTFTLAPRINVASRLASPQLAFDLLTTTDPLVAEKLSKELNSINAKRKLLVSKTMARVREQLLDKKYDTAPIIIVGNLDFKPPILGLVATQLIRTYKKPIFVWGKSDDGVIKGSVRSTNDIDIVALMSRVKDGVFINRGGHAQSGGFSMTEDSAKLLESAVYQSYVDIYGDTQMKSEMHEDILVDLEVDVRDIHAELYAQIVQLAPFGVGNEKPILAVKGIESVQVRKFGKDKEHLELDCGPFKAIQFFSEYSDDLLKNIEEMRNPTIIGHIELNQFRGAREIRLKLLHVV